MLLDTCALIWLAASQYKYFTAAVLKELNQAPQIFISAITGFEIGIKNRFKKLELPLPPDEWLTKVLDHHHISVIEINLEIALKTTLLPLIHGDPCDRFIIATAMIYHLPVVTTDKQYSKYGVEVVC